MSLEVIGNLSALRRLAPEWERLPLPSPMQSPAWLVSWWEAYGEADGGCELASLAVRDAEDRLIGFAPLYLKSHPLAGPSLRMLGDGRASTDHHTLLAASPEHEPEVVSAVAQWIAAEAGHAWRRVRFEALDSDDRAMNHLERLLSEQGLDTERIEDLGSFPAELIREDSPPDWEGFLSTLSKNRRKKLRRWDREWFESGRASLRVAQNEQDRAELWPELVRLHNERREGMGETGVFECERFDRFHRLASEQLLASGGLYFALLSLDGQPAAVEYSLQDSRSVYAYQGGISSAALDLDAGHLSIMGLTRHALQTGRTRLDLLRGDEPYKLSWGATHRPASTLHARPDTWTGKLERLAGNAYRGLRDSRKKVAEAG